MCHAIGLERLKALKIEKRLDIAVASRIAVIDGKNIGTDGDADLAIGFERVLEGLDDELGRDVGIGETLRQAMGQRLLKPLVVKDGAKNEAAEARLGFGDILSFLANAGPAGIERLDRLNLSRLAGHGVLLRQRGPSE